MCYKYSQIQSMYLLFSLPHTYYTYIIKPLFPKKPLISLLIITSGFAMKYKYLLYTCLCAAILPQCASRHKIAYNIPPDYPENKRKEFIALLDKGQQIYKANCSECHGIFTSGKDGVPNFSKVQIDNYSARFINRDPRNHAVLRKMSPDQLNQVLAFLRYKKTDGPPAVRKPQ